MKPLNLHTDNWLQNSYAARVAWHRRQARITIALTIALAATVAAFVWRMWP